MRLFLGILAVAAVAALEAAVATAAPPKPIPRTSGVSQYVEALPASDGPHFTAPRAAARGARAPLPAAAVRAVRREGGAQAQTLVEIASDPAFAAPRPAAAPRATPPRRGGTTTPSPTGPSAPTVVAGTGADAGAGGAAAGALGGSWLLLVGLLAVSALVVGTRRAAP